MEAKEQRISVEIEQKSDDVRNTKEGRVYIILLKNEVLIYCVLYFISKMQGSSTSVSSGSLSPSSKKKVSSEDIFKYVSMAVTFVLVFCVKGFLEFRAYCESKGYYVFAVDSLIWLAAGFFFIFVSFG